MYDRILVPTDGSEGSAHAAMRAVDLAGQYGASIHALYVVDESVRGLLGGLTGSGRLTEQGRHALDQVAALADASGVEAVTELREGDPADSILDYAEEVDADLLVAGTHGRSGVERRLVGSVAERLVRHAPCPVLTVRLPESDVTVEDAGDAERLAADALADAGFDADIVGTRRQTHLWVVEAESEGDAGDPLVYVDPVTQQTSVVPRPTGRYKNG